MKKIFLILLLLSAVSAYPQAWSGIIDPSRAVDWSSAGATISTTRTQCTTSQCNNLTASSNASAIMAALASAPQNTFVLLPAGTYNIGGIHWTNNNVTLRGSGTVGVNKTVLAMTSPDNCTGNQSDVCMLGVTSLYDNSPSVLPPCGGVNASFCADWTAGFTQGTTSLTLANIGTSTHAVGDLMFIDQANVITDDGGLIQCDVSSPVGGSGGSGVCSGNDGAFGRQMGKCSVGGASCSQDSACSGGTCSVALTRTAGGSYTIAHYSQVQVVKITNIAGSTYTITPGIYANNMVTAQTPGVWFSGAPNVGAALENLVIDHRNSSGNFGITFYNCYGCWMKNVQSIGPNSALRTHVYLTMSSHVSVVNSMVFGSRGAEQSYGIELNETSDDLIQNNIFDQVSSPVIFDNASGVVVAYNFSWNNLYTVNQNFMQTSLPSHDAGNMFNLFEGNYFNGLSADNQHGASPLATVFRNWLPGNQPSPFNKTQQTQAIGADAINRAWNVIDNVLGTPGYHDTYQTNTGGSNTKCNTSIYALGWGSVAAGCSTPGGGESTANPDAVVATSMFRWANYDTVNATTRYNTGEVPTVGIHYVNGNPVPTTICTSTIPCPNSLYLPNSGLLPPDFWNNAFASIPWPPIGGDVTGAITNVLNSGLNGHANPIPAMLCYQNATFTGSIMNFNADDCYGQTIQPTLANSPFYPNGRIRPIKQNNIFSAPHNSTEPDWTHFTALLGNSLLHQYATGTAEPIDGGCSANCTNKTYLDHIGTSSLAGSCPSITWTGTNSIDAFAVLVSNAGLINSWIIGDAGFGFSPNSVTNQYLWSQAWANNLDIDCATVNPVLTWQPNTAYLVSDYIKVGTHYWQIQTACTNDDPNINSCTSGSGSIPSFASSPQADNQASWIDVGTNAPPLDGWVDANYKGTNVYQLTVSGNASLTSNVATVPVTTPPTYSIGNLVTIAVGDANFNCTNCPVVAPINSSTVSYTKVHANVGTTAVTGTITGAHSLNINTQNATLSMLQTTLPIPYELPMRTHRKYLINQMGIHYTTSGNPVVGKFRNGFTKAGEADTTNLNSWPYGSQATYLTYEDDMLHYQQTIGCGTKFVCDINLHSFPTQEAALGATYTHGFDNNALGATQLSQIIAGGCGVGCPNNGGDWPTNFALNNVAQSNGFFPELVLQDTDISSPGTCTINTTPQTTGALSFDPFCTTTPFITGYPGNDVIASQYLTNSREKYFCDWLLMLDPNYSTSHCAPNGTTPPIYDQATYAPLYKIAFANFLANPVTTIGLNIEPLKHSTINFLPTVVDCGPPIYACGSLLTTNSGNISAPFNSTAPTSTTCSGDCQNSKKFVNVIPGVLQNTIVYTRMTDGSSWQNGNSAGNVTFSGGAIDHNFSKNGTYVSWTGGGGTNNIYHLGYSGGIHVINTGVPGINKGGPIAFSAQVDTRFYNIPTTHRNELHQFDITSDTTVTDILLADLTANDICPGLPQPFGTVTSNSILGRSLDDDKLAIVLSNSGGQGTGHWVIVWSKTLGCSTVDFLTGQAWAYCTVSCSSAVALGTFNPAVACYGATSATTNGIHGIQMDEQGQYIFASVGPVAWGNCFGIASNSSSVWHIATLDDQFCDGRAPAAGGTGCGGHPANGYSHRLSDSIVGAGPNIRADNDLLNYTPISATLTVQDLHGDLPDCNNLHDDTCPWINASDLVKPNQGSGTNCVSAVYCPIAYSNEIFAIPTTVGYPPGLPIIRFGPTYSCNVTTTNNTYATCNDAFGGDDSFGAQQAIGSATNDGKYYCYASTMFHQMGLDNTGVPRADIICVGIGAGSGG